MMRNVKHLWKKLPTKVSQNLKEIFSNTCNFSNNDDSKFILLLRKGVYIYEYIYDWKKFNEASLPEKQEFLKSLKSGRYHQCKLCASKKTL